MRVPALNRDSPRVGDPVPHRLNLGCGRDRKPGCLNVDVNPAVEPDLAWDLDRRPYPLPRNHFETIFANDVVEHLDDPMGFLTEVHDLLVPGGKVVITTPHFSCSNSYTDPTHRRHLGYFSFDYLTEESSLRFYTGVRFAITKRLLVFQNGRLDRCVAWWANRHPALYERRFAWLFPAWFLIFELSAVQQDEAPR